MISRLERLNKQAILQQKDCLFWKEKVRKTEQELLEAKEKLQLLQAEYEKLDNNLKVYNLATFIDVPDQNDLKKVLNEMIRDIDGCLAMLEE